MLLSEFSIKRPIATVVITVTLMLFGYLALKSLRVNERPDIEMPLLIVNIPYPGASPETVEREIVVRIEKSLQSIPGVYEIRTTASESSGRFLIFFNFDKNTIEATDEVRNAISSVRHKLPLEMREPIIQRFDVNSQPIVQISLSSTVQSHAELSRLAEDDLAEEFRGIEGVAVVNVNGALHRELSVLLRSTDLRQYNVSVTDVLNALRNQNLTAPVGRIRGEYEDQSLRLLGRIADAKDFNDIIVKRRGHELVRLSQVATVQDGFADMTSLSLRNGKSDLGINIVRSREASTVKTAKLVREKLEELNTRLVSGTTLTVTQDGGKDAQDSLNNVIEALVLGALLTIFVVYAFLNSWRSTLITSLALPTSVLTSFIAVWAAGFTLNFMTLLGLSLSIGVLIDDAIVVRENIVRHMERGKDRFTAAREGTNEIGLAVTATTLAIVAVFIPVGFMDGVTGEWFRPFALTVAASVLVSLLISFSLDPMLSAYWGDPVDHQTAPKRGIEKYFAKFNQWFDHQSERYMAVIQWALFHRVKVALISVATFVLALVLQVTLGGSSFLPKSDVGFIAIDIRMPSGASLEYARIKTEQAAMLARNIPEVESTSSSIRPDNGRVYVDIGKKSDRSRSAEAIGTQLRGEVKRLVGAEYVVLDDLNNGTQKPLNIRFSGPDSRTLMEITNNFMQRLGSEVPGAVDIGLSQQDPIPEYQIEIDRGLANSIGISVNDAAQALRVAYAGVEVGDWVDPTGETRDVAVRLHPDDRRDRNDLERLPLITSAGDVVIPLQQIATITMGVGPARIEHVDGKRMVSVSANVEGRPQNEVISAAMKLAKSMDFPPGYGIDLAGSGRDQAEVFSRMMIALVMGVGLMYLVLVIQFGSFLAPLAIMMSLPLSLIGVVIGLLVTGATINLMSLIGVIMLMGLVAKNAILLIDCARDREKEGHSREEALMRAGKARLRPIMMTTLALIAGMLPVALSTSEGGEFYKPLAISIIGGIATSTLLTLLAIPTFYDSIHISHDRLIAKFHMRLAERGFVSACLLIAIETVLTLMLIRFGYRLFKRCILYLSNRYHLRSALN